MTPPRPGECERHRRKHLVSCGVVIIAGGLVITPVLGRIRRHPEIPAVDLDGQRNTPQQRHPDEIDQHDLQLIPDPGGVHGPGHPCGIPTGPRQLFQDFEDAVDRPGETQQTTHHHQGLDDEDEHLGQRGTLGVTGTAGVTGAAGTGMIRVVRGHHSPGWDMGEASREKLYAQMPPRALMWIFKCGHGKALHRPGP
ncbi:hypothetical protein [Corynebacterium efficiens YS-314]|uniref:Uncharacterized protein n=1 Tax=Corynebacterium efficiens (strain DSM 44549 / YS-314 / AJ 12310 / JCM 11189 / NBRC 100395) TaxID=196164 RepID=Q8FLM6_COREF|nr:hypothetical protein [Corynebacterium efficiens YS-314]